MGRSSWKPFYVAKDFLKQQDNQKNNENEDIILYNRATVIRKYMVGLKVQIYNGIRFFLIEITSEMTGHCLGEFAPTRKIPMLKQKKKNLKTKKK